MAQLLVGTLSETPFGAIVSGIIPIIIPVYGREDAFATVALLRAQPYADKLRLVIVDNGNKAELSLRLKALEGTDCHVISFPENRGGSAAYIVGVEYAMREFPEAPYVWLLDDDAKPNVRTLPGLVETMDRLVREDAKAASLGSTVVSAADSDRIVECGAAFSPLLGHSFPKLRGNCLSEVGDQTVRVDYAAACSLLVRTEAVRALGFWEDVFIHFDDIEWGVRTTRAGWHNYATTASTVVHPEFDPKKAGAWVCYFDARNQYWFASKFGPFHVAVAWLKNKAKDFRAQLTGELVGGNAYRALAWRDHKAGIRRTRTEVMRIVKEDEI